MKMTDKFLAKKHTSTSFQFIFYLRELDSIYILHFYFYLREKVLAMGNDMAEK